jgi:hypothetical protein
MVGGLIALQIGNLFNATLVSARPAFWEIHQPRELVAEAVRRPPQLEVDIAYGPVGQPLTHRCAPRSFNGSEVICDYSAGSGTDYTFAVAVGGQWSDHRGADRFDYPVPPVVLTVQGCPTNRGNCCCGTQALSDPSNGRR